MSTKRASEISKFSTMNGDQQALITNLDLMIINLNRCAAYINNTSTSFKSQFFLLYSTIQQQKL